MKTHYYVTFIGNLIEGVAVNIGIPFLYYQIYGMPFTNVQIHLTTYYVFYGLIIAHILETVLKHSHP